MKRVTALLFVMLLVLAPAPALATVIGPPCATPAGITVPTSDPDGSYTVRWGASTTPGVTYRLQEATDAAFTTGLRTAYTGTALRAPITGRQAGKTYYYRVRATTPVLPVSLWNAGANGCAVRPPCAIPADLTVPATASRGSYTVHWGASTSTGVTYLLEEATDDAFTTGLRTAYSGTAFSTAISGRQAGKTYYYRVQAVKAGRPSSRWRAGANGCRVLLPCPAPARILVPASDADGNFFISWSPAPAAGVTYVVQEATDPGFTTGLRTLYRGSALTLPLLGRSNGIYYYRVRATNDEVAPSAWKSSANGCVTFGNGDWYLDLIVNLNYILDPGEVMEVTEDRLYNNWNGTNSNAIIPTAPIPAAKYNHQATITVYDTLGASHVLTVYFDRTTLQNQWEFLVTCNPVTDRRLLTAAEQVIYAPATRYDFQNHKGAGALLYGILHFDTSGNIAQIDAFKVPPDGRVEPAKNDNRLRLEPGDLYFSIPTNFTGADTDQQIMLNFGARCVGMSLRRQVLISDAGAWAVDRNGNSLGLITSETPWSQVADENGKVISQGDILIFEGYDHASQEVNRLVYTVEPDRAVGDLLSQLEVTFTCSASIDDQGRLRLSDNVSGASGLAVTRFETYSANGATPFGHGDRSNDQGFFLTAEGITSDGGTAITADSASLVGVRGSASQPLGAGDSFTFTGTDLDGKAVHQTFTVRAGDTIRMLLNSMEGAYGGAEGEEVKALLDQNGRVRLLTTGRSGPLAVAIAYASADGLGMANPFGLLDGAPATSLGRHPSTESRIDITTAKQMVYSSGRALRTNSGEILPITATTPWSSVFDDNRDPAGNGGFPRGVGDGDTITFSGRTGDGTLVTSTFTVAYRKADGAPGTVQDLLDQLESDFACQASIDAAGRLLLTERLADQIWWRSLLGINAVTYGYATHSAPGLGHDIFGPAGRPFDYIPSDLTEEDGSQQGDMVTTNVAPEGLATTQYAAKCITIYQNFYGR